MARTVNPLTRLKRAIKKATRPALERTFLHWRDHKAPHHFGREAFERYPKEYQASAKRNQAAWLAKRKKLVQKHLADPQARPLVRSHAFQRAFLHGGVGYTGSGDRLRVRWLNLPRHATLRNKYSAFSVAEAATTVSDKEKSTLKQVYSGWLAKFAANDSQIPIRTYGLAVLKS